MDHIGRFEVLISGMKATAGTGTFVELERMAGRSRPLVRVAATAGAAASPCGAATTPRNGAASRCAGRHARCHLSVGLDRRTRTSPDQPAACLARRPSLLTFMARRQP